MKQKLSYKTSLFILFLIISIPSWPQKCLNLNTQTLSNTITETAPDVSVERITNGIEVTYKFNYVTVSDDDLYPDAKRFKISGFGTSSISGEPELLERVDSYVIPVGYYGHVSLISSTYKEFNYAIGPSRPPLEESSDEQYSLDNVLPITPYSGFKPSIPTSIMPISYYRDQAIIRVSITPIVYDYENHKTRIYSHLKYRITYESKQNENESGTIYREPGSLLNISGTLPIFSLDNNNPKAYKAQSDNNIQADVSYLIITTPKYRYALNKFIEWKKVLGYNVTVLENNTWTQESIKEAIQDLYKKDRSLMYLLLVGNYTEVPGYTESYITLPDGTIVNPFQSDLPYGCVSNNTSCIPDLYRGRLPVGSSNDVTNITDKIIWYEQTPSTDSLFYRKAAHVAYFQDNNNDGEEDRGFVKTSEDIRNYLSDNHSKEIQRIYLTNTCPEKTPPYRWNSTNYADGTLLPQDLRENFLWNGNSKTIQDAINDGRFYILYRGHGYVNGLAHINFDNQSINQTTNNEWQPIFFSITCSTGQYNTPKPCFAEKLITSLDGGAVGVFAASKTSYSEQNDVLAYSIIQNIWPQPGLKPILKSGNFLNNWNENQIPAYQLGQILDMAILNILSSYADTELKKYYTAKIYHCFGDPSMMIRTEVPSPYNNVLINKDSNKIEVEIDESAYISFYDHISDHSTRYLGTKATYSTSNPENVSISISGPNRIPYVVYGNDAKPWGTDDTTRENYIINCGESIAKGGVAVVHYKITMPFNRANIAIVDLRTNSIISDRSCIQGEEIISFHVGQGIYSASLIIDGRLYDNKKFFVSHSFH